MKPNFIDIVKLMESPSSRSPWYVVEGPNGKYYVSSLGGRAAKGLQVGTKLSLYRQDSKNISHYVLER